ncbi:MAG TPA: HPP family protein [Pseudomonadales bacterium]|nr:HPP family protein [Pseudomonadales bacterium]
MKKTWWQIKHVMGVPAHTPSWREQCAAVLTSAIGIAIVAWIATQVTHSSEYHPALIASIGATAVLVFAVPHGALSQPWAVLGGHTISALIGLAVVHTLGGGNLSAALAVALAIGAMHLGKCIHPPGGATALSAVLAAQPDALTPWTFLLNPVWLNVFPIVLLTYVLNLPFPWRRYPANMHSHLAVQPLKTAQLEQEMPFTERHLARALNDIDAMIDISDDQLQQVYQALARQQEGTHISEEQLKPGAFYSNGLSGDAWAVRQIIDSSEPAARKQQVIYKTIAGANKSEIRVVQRKQFAAWARYEVCAGAERWERV